MNFDERINNPTKFVLKKDKLAIGIINREYGVVCQNCGGIDFSEDEGLTKIICSNCKKTLAIRAIVDVCWINEEEVYE